MNQHLYMFGDFKWSTPIGTEQITQQLDGLMVEPLQTILRMEVVSEMQNEIYEN